MPDEDRDLRVNTADLLMAGEVDLPHLAYLYATLNRTAASTADLDGNAFNSVESPDAGSGGGAGMYQEWCRLRKLLQDALGHSATNLEAVGDTLVYIAKVYAEQDETSAAELRKIWPDRADGHADKNDQPPPSIPAVVIE